MFHTVFAHFVVLMLIMFMRKIKQHFLQKYELSCNCLYCAILVLAVLYNNL